MKCSSSSRFICCQVTNDIRIRMVHKVSSNYFCDVRPPAAMGKIHVHQHRMFYRITYVKIELSILPLLFSLKTIVDWTIDKKIKIRNWTLGLNPQCLKFRTKLTKIIQHCFSLMPLANYNDFFCWKSQQVIYRLSSHTVR